VYGPAIAAADRIVSWALPDGAERAGAAPCPRPPAVTPIWWDGRTLLTADGTGVVGCTVDGSVERLGRPHGIGTRFEFVPPLGVKVPPRASRPVE